jgi:hypothetical protein
MNQLFFLFEYSQDKENKMLKASASMHGIQVDDSDGKVKTKQKKNDFLFQDPKEYENLSQEEKERKTKEMMGHFSKFASDPIRYTRKKG